MESSSLVIFSKASEMLAQADTIQKTKELKDLALTAADWAKHKGMGEDAIRFATSYALDAARKMGEMLQRTERAKGTDKGGRQYSDSNKPLPSNAPPTLSELGITKRESSEAQKLASLPNDTFEKIKTGETTITQVKREIEKKAHVSYNSGENEWYTPSDIIVLVREILGEIDCDPASSEIANKTVKAKKFFTIETDGLNNKWGAKVYMNPPYATPLISQFTQAFAEKFKSGEIKEGCVLVNNATETVWFQTVLAVSSACCFIKSRIRFVDPQGKQGNAPLQGQVILYFGKNAKEFKKVFEDRGITLFNG